MGKSENINELASALSKAQGEMGAAKKDSTNPFFKSGYADLASVREATREPLLKNGLCVIQATDCDDNGNVYLITTLAHSSGQYIESRYPIRPLKNDPQAMGSALTYARRYTLSAIVGIVQDDDDGEAAMNRLSTAPSGKKSSGRAAKPTTHGPKPSPAADKKVDESLGEHKITKGRMTGKVLKDETPKDLQKWLDEMTAKQKDGLDVSEFRPDMVAVYKYLKSKGKVE